MSMKRPLFETTRFTMVIENIIRVGVNTNTQAVFKEEFE